MEITVHIYTHDSASSKIVAQILSTVNQIKQEINKMATIDEVKAAVAAAAQEVKDAVNAAVAQETAQVIAQIQAIPVGQPISQQDLDDIVTSVRGIAPAAVQAIDSISVNDVPAPPAPPVP